MKHLNVAYIGLEFVFIYIPSVEGALVVEDPSVTDKYNDLNTLITKSLANQGNMYFNWIIITCCLFERLFMP